MKLLLDINILLDVALRRLPWSEDARDLFAEIERKRAVAFVASHTITTAHYVIGRARNRQVASDAVAGFLRLFDVVPVERSDFQHALVLDLPDFEDAVQTVCAINIGADYLITRNPKDFQGIPVPVHDPAGVLMLLRATAS